MSSAPNDPPAMNAPKNIGIFAGNDLVTLPIAFLVALPVAIASGVAVFAVTDVLTGNRLNEDVVSALTLFCMGASGAVPVLAAFAVFHLGETFKRVIGPVLLLAGIPGVVSVVAYNLAGSPHPNDLLADNQPELMIAWQTTVGVLLGCLEATHDPQSASRPPEELVT
jgi:uncharacterized protein (DUF486 family)